MSLSKYLVLREKLLVIISSFLPSSDSLVCLCLQNFHYFYEACIHALCTLCSLCIFIECCKLVTCRLPLGVCGPKQVEVTWLSAGSQDHVTIVCVYIYYTRLSIGKLMPPHF